MTTDDLREVVFRVLERIAPEADLKSVDPRVNFRDQLDIDSVDFLNFVIGLHGELGIEIPEVDLPKLATLDGCISYLLARVNPHDSPSSSG